MDANSIAIILDNTRGWSDAALAAAEKVMTRAGVLYGCTNDAEEPARPVAALVGEAVKDMIADRARIEDDLTEDGANTMASAIFYTTLGHIDWTEVGRHYYTRAYERSREMGSGR